MPFEFISCSNWYEKMTMTDLDPTFIKALRLLHSKSKDSADQLKQLLDDVLHAKKGHKVTLYLSFYLW